MHILAYPLTFIFILGVLVVAHEWGHFIVARIFKIRVDEFSIGFGPRALRIGQLGETEYNIRWIPLGGFVRIAGMDIDQKPILIAADMIKGSAPAEPGEDRGGLGMNLDDTSVTDTDPGEEGFFAHPVWQRALVIFAGPFMSFFLGYLIFFGLPLTMGVVDSPMSNKVDSVLPGSTAQAMGLKAGDVIADINGVKVTSGEYLVDTIHGSMNKKVVLTIERDGKDITLTGVPQRTVVDDGPPVGTLGFAPAPLSSTLHRVGVGESFMLANRLTEMWLSEVGALFRHPSIQKFRQNAGGPIFIAQVTKQAVDQGGDSVPMEMAAISMSLALFNMLPIPILDGGYLLMFFLEFVRRGKRLTFAEQQNFMLAGLAVIGVLFVFIMFNDLARAVHPIGQ